MPISEPKAPKKKDKRVDLRLDDDLYSDATQYAKDQGISLGAVIRILLRRFANPRDPRMLPPEEVAIEQKRPSRKRKDE